MRNTPLIALASLAVASLATQGRAAQYQVGPAPSWVVPIAVDTAWQLPEEEQTGLDAVLTDLQVRADGDAVFDWYYHGAERITDANSLDDGSELTFDWDPAYETLQIHMARVHRDGQALDRLRDARVEVLRRETDKDNQLYDGTLSAALIVPDVRVGDIIEYASTRRGHNPVLRGHFSMTASQGQSWPVHRRFFRLTWLGSAPLQWRAFSSGALPERETEPGVGERWRVELFDTAAVDDEGDMPGSYSPFPRLAVTSDASWASVERWASDVYRPVLAAPLGSELRGQLDEWRGLTTDAARVDAVLRFVQANIRYVGIELGEGSHRPSPASQTLARRFGDCKDKAVLVVAALRALGIDAHAALVNTWRGAALDESLPTPAAFDHVIAVARVGVDGAERELWFDPTEDEQGGDWRTREPPAFARALVIADDAPSERHADAQLVPLPVVELDQPSVIVEDRWTLDDETAGADVQIVSRYFGAAADAERADIRTQSKKDLEARYLDYTSEVYRGARKTAPLEIVDDVAANVLTTTERYRITQLWQAEKVPTADVESATFVATAVRDRLRWPKLVAARRHPLATRHPVYVRHDMHVELNGGFSVKPERRVVDDSAFGAELDVQVGPRAGQPRTDRGALDMHFTLRSKARVVEPQAFAAHVTHLEETPASFAITRRIAGAPQRDETNWPVVALALAVLLLGSAGAVRVFLVRAPAQPPVEGPVQDRSRLSGTALREHDRATGRFGGALWVIAPVLVISPITAVVAVVRQVDALGQSSWEKLASPTSASYLPGWAPLAIAELVANCVIAVVVILCAALYLARKRTFMLVFAIATATGLVVSVLDYVLVAQVLHETPVSGATVAMRVFWAVVWIRYLTTSRRLRARFVR